jgi:prolyl oligopeptidase
MKVRDVATGEDLPDVIPGLRFTGARWDKGSSAGFQYNKAADDGKRRFVSMHHTIGDAPENDPFVFGVDEEDAFASTFRVKDSKDEWANVSIGTLPQNGLWRRKAGTAEFVKMFDHSVASYEPVAEIDGRIYMVTDYQTPRQKLVAFNPDTPDPKNWETIIPEHETDLLHWVSLHQGIFLVEHGHDTADKLSVHALNGDHLHDAPTPIQSTLSFAKINKTDETLLLTIANFQQPGARYHYDFKNNTLDLVKPSTAPETLTDCIVERIHATSKDGTKVPMTVIRHPDTKLDGTAAVKLYGYGGFNVPLGPDYGTTIASWIRAGGIYAQANLRGGGEYGSEWYDQGRKHNKQNVFDDFAACAEKLIADRYTRAKRLVIEGGSNGGLLTLATMLQRPELFGAVISDVPVTDMYRFHKHTHGAAWRSDYGDSEANKADFETASRYSPLHNVRRKIYPPTLLNTGDHDDRVVPSHAYKFVATMQAKAHPESVCLLRVETRAGHGAGKPTDKVIQEAADTHAFVERAIGPINQVDYVLAVKARRKPDAPQP